MPSVPAAGQVFRILSTVSLVTSLAVASIIFLIDVRVPLGLTIYILYVVPVLVSLLADNHVATRQLAGILTALIALGYVFSPAAGVPHWIVVWDRIIAVVVVWTTAILGWEMASAKRQIRVMENVLVMCAWTRQVKVDGQWIALEAYLAQYCGVTLSHGISREAADELLQARGLDVR